MKILFDQGTPVPLRKLLPEHLIVTAYELGWQTLENGSLIAAAEADGFEVIITTDQNLKYQQDLTNRSISIVVLSTTSWPRIREDVTAIQNVLDSLLPSSFLEIKIK
jgi:predicted nuclease of predicted toxin-antitoxin system